MLFLLLFEIILLKNDNINGKVAIIKMVEKIFQTEKHDGYYTYIDNFGNSYNIKEITNITSEDNILKHAKITFI